MILHFTVFLEDDSTLEPKLLMDNFRPLKSDKILIFFLYPTHPLIPVYLPNLYNYVARQHILEVPYMWLHTEATDHINTKVLLPGFVLMSMRLYFDDFNKNVGLTYDFLCIDSL